MVGHGRRIEGTGRDCCQYCCARVEGQGSLTAFSRTDRTVLDYGIYAGHPAGRWPADTDSGALAGRTPSIYGTEGLARLQLTATVTATAATNGIRQRSPAHANTRTFHADLGIRPA